MYDILWDLIFKFNLDQNLCMIFSNVVDLVEVVFCQKEGKEIKIKNVNLFKYKWFYNCGVLDVGFFE